MRRAEERSSASVMISNSIRWSLVGNDVDCRMKASEPRTFSWISTKISMSAKRRTTPLVRGTPIPSAIACASAGLELPAISLMEPFLADIDASPRALLDTTFSISRNPRETGAFRWARRYQARGAAGNPLPPFSRPKMGRYGTLSTALVGAEAKRSDRGAAADRGRSGRRIRRSIDHAGEAGEAGLRNLPQDEVVGCCPGVASGLAGRFFAGKPQCALLVVVVDVPDPGDRGLAAHHLRREIAAHAVGSSALAGDDRQVAHLRFAVEHVNHPVEYLRRRAVDRFERHGRTAARRSHRVRAAARCATPGAAAERRGNDKQHRRDHGARRLQARSWNGVAHCSLRYR